MSTIEVMVASMQQKDFSLYQKMNIQSDLIIANQSNCYNYEELVDGENTVKMITTATRGVGLNRNIGLQYITADIIVLADEDIVYNDGYVEMVKNAFEQIPNADVLIFQMRFIRDGQVYDIDRHKTKKLHLWNGLSFGTYQIAIRKEALLRSNLHFTHLFGGGCVYCAGEDSLFLIDCFRRGLSVYSYAALLGDNIRDTSSWFKGFNEKFFYDRGAFSACAFRKFGLPICVYYLFMYRNEKEISLSDKWRLMKAGYQNFKSLLTYERWRNE